MAMLTSGECEDGVQKRAQKYKLCNFSNATASADIVGCSFSFVGHDKTR